MGCSSSKNDVAAPTTVKAVVKGNALRVLQSTHSAVDGSERDFLLRGTQLKVYRDILQHGVDVVDASGNVVKTYKYVKGWSTEEVCQKILKPACESDLALFANILEDRSLISPQKYQGVFVSQARSCNFEQLVSALLQRFPPETYVWTDILHVNQFSYQKLPTDARRKWLGEGLHETLGSFDSRVLMFNTWDNPVILQRAWCAWEFLGCALQNKGVEILLEKNEETRFVKEALLGDVKSIFDGLSKMDIEKCQCWNEDDRNMIFDKIRSTVGFTRVNELVLDQLREWFISSGKKHRETVKGKGTDEGQLLKNIALVLMDFGRFEEALSFIDQALPILEKADERSPELGALLNNKASCLMAVDKIDDALGCAQKALDKFTALDPNHSRVGVALTNLGAIMMRKNPPDLSGAKEHYERALVVFKDNEDDENCATSLSNIAEILLMDGNTDAAVEMLDAAVKQFSKPGAVEHIWLAPILCNLGVALREQGKVDEAKSKLEAALALQRRVLGTKHPNVSVTLTDMGKCHCMCKDFNKELECLQEALQISIFAYGYDSRDVAVHLSNIANYYDARGKKDEALKHAKESTAVFEKIFGPKDSYTLAMKDAWNL